MISSLRFFKSLGPTRILRTGTVVSLSRPLSPWPTTAAGALVATRREEQLAGLSLSNQHQVRCMSKAIERARRRAIRQEYKLKRKHKAERRKIVDEEYHDKLKLLLKERHDIKFYPGKNVPMDQKWRKKGWKLALVLHYKEQEEVTGVSYEEELCCIRTPEPFIKIVELWASKQKEYPTKNERRKKRSEVENAQFEIWMKMLREALVERNESPEGTLQQIQYRIQDSVLLGAGLDLPTITGHLEETKNNDNDEDHEQKDEEDDQSQQLVSEMRARGIDVPDMPGGKY